MAAILSRRLYSAQHPSQDQHDTQKVYLEAIKRLCLWEAEKIIDLEFRFQGQEFLGPYEIDELARPKQPATKELIAAPARHLVAYISEGMAK